MKRAPHIKRTFRLSVDVANALAEHARKRRVPQNDILEAALTSFLSPDGADRLEAALARRLDRLTRQFERLEWNADLTTETLAMFIRSWLINSIPLPESELGAAQIRGKDRWSRFLESLVRKMEQGPRLTREISRDVTD